MKLVELFVHVIDELTQRSIDYKAVILNIFLRFSVSKFFRLSFKMNTNLFSLSKCIQVFQIFKSEINCQNRVIRTVSLLYFGDLTMVIPCSTVMIRVSNNLGDLFLLLYF